MSNSSEKSENSEYANQTEKEKRNAENLHIVYALQKALPNDVKEYICGWGAAFINITTTYPIYKVIFRQMLHGVDTASAYRQLSEEGVSFLYRGMLPPLMQKTVSVSLMFGMYEEIKDPLINVQVPTVLAKTIAAMLAGSAEALLMPFERIQTLLQDKNYHEHFKNSGHAFREIRSTYGILECFRGFVPILMRNSLSNVMFFHLRDEAKYYFPHKGTWYQVAGHEFFTGAVIGAFTSTVFYPLNVIKVQMQSTVGGPFQNMFSVLFQLYSDRGFRSMFSGVHLNYTRAFISWGIINASYEFLRRIMFDEY